MIDITVKFTNGSEIMALKSNFPGLFIFNNQELTIGQLAYIGWHPFNK